MTFAITLSILVGLAAHTLLMQWRNDIFHGGKQ